MPSPFPGMDPYLEQPALWPDFHDRFINCWSEAIADRLPAGYDVRIAERVYLSEPNNPPRRIVPDVTVTRREVDAEDNPLSGASETRHALTLEPVILPLPELDPIIERFIQLTTVPDRRVVTVLELLSPTNKSGRGRVEYLDQRDEVNKTSVHLVELDLLLGGHRLPMGGALPRGDYFAMVARGDDRPNCEVYAWQAADPLPSIPIPLRGSDGDIRLGLAEVFSVAFERGRYPRVLRYDQDPNVNMSPEKLAWAREVASGGH